MPLSLSRYEEERAMYEAEKLGFVEPLRRDGFWSRAVGFLAEGFVTGVESVVEALSRWCR